MSQSQKTALLKLAAKYADVDIDRLDNGSLWVTTDTGYEFSISVDGITCCQCSPFYDEY
jgi:hypothetical protein